MLKNTVEFKSVKNTNEHKPNEDYLLVDKENAIFIISDGITRTNVKDVYPEPSPSSKVAEIFSESVFNFLNQQIEKYETEILLYKAIVDANKKVKAYNDNMFPEVDYLGNDYAGTVFIIGMIKNGYLHYAYIGDCICLTVENNNIKLATKIQTKNVERYRKKVGFSDDATLNIRKNFRNNPFHPNGFGAITGEAGCIDFVMLDKIDLKLYDRIILMSDGLLDLYKQEPEIFINSSIDEILSKASVLEQELNLRSDDKSIVIINNC